MFVVEGISVIVLAYHILVQSTDYVPILFLLIGCHRPSRLACHTCTHCMNTDDGSVCSPTDTTISARQDARVKLMRISQTHIALHKFSETRMHGHGHATRSLCCELATEHPIAELDVWPGFCFETRLNWSI